MDEPALLDKWKTAPRVDDIMRYLQKRIDARRRTGILFDDEIRTELGVWLTEVLADRPADESTLQHYLDTLFTDVVEVHGDRLFRDDEAMFAFRGADGGIRSRRWTAGAWGEIVPTGHSTDGSLVLGALGPSLYLVFKTRGRTSLRAVSYNSADFNVVTLAASKYAGSYDDTTVHAWSPSAFPVAAAGVLARRWKGAVLD